MTPPPTNWLPGLIVLAVGCIAAAFYLFLQRSKAAAESKDASASRPGELDDLERRYQSLIEQLKELATDKHGVTPERYEAERSRLELEAAAALRARDEFLKSPAMVRAAARATPAPTGGLSPQLKGALWGGGIVLFFCTLGYLLVSEQHTRGDQESATGRMPPGMNANAGGDAQAQQQQGDPDLDQAWERFKNNPSDLEAAAVLSHELIRRQMYDDAERITQRGLALDPFYVELRVHEGVLHAVRTGDEAGAEKQLRMLADLYPDAQEGMLFLGALEMRQGDKAKALESFERFAVEVPSNMHPPPLLGAIQQLRSELGR